MRAAQPDLQVQDIAIGPIAQNGMDMLRMKTAGTAAKPAPGTASPTPVALAAHARGARRAVATTVRRTRTAWGEVLRSEAGDVPGWVLVTLMTAGLVALIWALAAPMLGALFDQAIARVSGF